jgi:hypothetical protein
VLSNRLVVHHHARTVFPSAAARFWGEGHVQRSPSKSQRSRHCSILPLGIE